MDYSYSRRLSVSFDDAVQKAREALKEEGFGIITEVDVKATMKEKLDIEFKKYSILGACNPRSALEALQAEKEVGLLLPCNVIIYEDGDETVVSAIRPDVAMGFVENDALKPLAKRIGEALERAVANM